MKLESESTPAGKSGDRSVVEEPLLLGSLVVLLVVIGALGYQRASRTVYIDETWIATRIRSGRYEPHGVPTPPLYFFTSLAWSKLVGATDLLLRLPALAFHLVAAALPLLLRKRTAHWLSYRASAIWSILLALASPFAFYGTRIKQYTSEACMATVLLCLALWLAESPRDRRRLGWFFAVGLVVAASTHGGPFLLLATGVFLSAAAMLVRDSEKEPMVRVSAGFPVASLHAALALVFGICWFLFLKPGTGVERQFGDLSQYFTQTGGRFYFDGTPAFFVRRTADWLGQYLNLTPLLLPSAAAAVCLWLVLPGGDRVRRWLLVSLGALPVLAVLGISATRAYPYGEIRLMAFAFPGVAMIIAAALEHAAGLLRRRSLLATAILTTWAVISLGNGVIGESYNRTYMRSFDQAMLWDSLARSVGGSDRVLAWNNEGTPLLYHHPELRRRTTEFDGLVGTPAWPEPSGAVWLVQRAQKPLFHEFPSGWRRTIEIEDIGVTAIRYERTAPSQ